VSVKQKIGVAAAAERWQRELVVKEADVVELMVWTDKALPLIQAIARHDLGSLGIREQLEAIELVREIYQGVARRRRAVAAPGGTGGQGNRTEL